ncbi:MAG: ABC transporter permease [Pseudonocardia sp.]|uniref:ABC transporter permease n=1 Tax=unclassified Pseudonocardia TaxID=2619320 RepID=UPI00086A57EF|nr:MULTISPECIES: ABC transporter permease [unclassified Pseudonocardia]MBN9110955.1 ABC transporter permease [Pseudonocardia sp.]ODU25037.1 MAG: ABC transporter permease [Pseudonocardia sp. SCN 72-51]ODV05007.1 MAG: ABC transporter permease [Pseudonocardia sp. SCN 73-27]
MTATIDATTSALPESAAPPTTTTRRRRRMTVSARIAAGVVGLIVLVAIVGPFLVGDPNAGDAARRLLPVGTAGHILGTDGQGRDVFARIVDGTRLSLLAGLVPVLFAAVVGTALGVTAGLAGKWGHRSIMRTLDVFYAFPAVLLAIAIAAALGSGISNSIIALAVILVPPVARVAETETRRLADLDYMDAARASGASRLAIATRQVLPNVAPPVVVYCTALIGLSIVYAAGLSFLGLGVSPPTAEWGLMVSDHTQYIYTAPFLAAIPAIAILVASVAFNVLGDGLRDLLDVRSEARA